MLFESFLVWSNNFIISFGYFGIFIVSIIGTATILFPFPVDIIIFTSSGFFNPLLIGIIAGIGSAIGELTSYYIGRAGRKFVIIKIKEGERFSKAEKLLNKYGFWTIPLFAFTPLPMDIIGLICGNIKYSVKKFFIGLLIGKIPRSLIFALAGNYAMSWILELYNLV